MRFLPVLVVSVFSSIAATGASIHLARHFNIVDMPGEIKIHSIPTPRIGGLGIATGVILGSAIGCQFVCCPGTPPSLLPVWLLLGATIILLLGVTDDLFGLTPTHKLVGELVSGGAFAAAIWPVVCARLGSMMLRLVTTSAVIVVVAFFENSINLLDGMDGLAGGVTLLISSFLAIAAAVRSQHGIAAIAASLAASCLGFLKYNLPHAKTFMGDVGSLFLGYVIAVIIVSLFALQPPSLPDVMGIFIILLVPIVDTCLAVVRRFSTGRRIFAGDRLHLYDRIHAATGRSIWVTLAVMWGATGVSGAFGIWVVASGSIAACLSAVVVVAGILYLAGTLSCLGVLSSPVSGRRDGLQR